MAETVKTVLCPKCGKEMLPGRSSLGGGHHLYWLPENTTSRFPKALYLGVSRFRPKRHPSWYCQTCEFITIDCKHYYD